MEGLCGPDTRFSMKQGVLTLCKVLVNKGHPCSRPKRAREKCESVRGCIVDANLSALNLVIVGKTKGEKVLDWQVPLCLSSWGPQKRAELESSPLSLQMMSINMWSENP